MLLRTSSRKLQVYPWVNAATVSQLSSTILHEFGVQSSTFFSTSANSPPLPPPSPPTEAEQKREHAKALNAAFQDFKRSIIRDQPDKAAAAMETFHLLADSPPPRHMHHSLMDLYSRRGDANNAIRILHDLIDNGPPPNQHSFGYVLSSLKKGAKKGSRSPQSAADDALLVFDTMLSLKVPPNATVYNELMDCIGKAGRVDQAFEYFQHSIVNGVPPSLFTFNILIKACSVAQQLDRAIDVVVTLMPEHGFTPGTAAWNGLISAAAECESIDRAYELWQEMNASGVAADIHTERVIAKAFSRHPQLAAELVSEARALAKKQQWRLAQQQQPLDDRKAKVNEKKMENGLNSSNRNYLDSISSGVDSVDSASVRMTPSTQQPVLVDELKHRLENKLTSRTLGLAPQFPSLTSGRTTTTTTTKSTGAKTTRTLVDSNSSATTTTTTTKTTAKLSSWKHLMLLDLHGHSQAAAQMALLRRLEALVEAWPAIQQDTKNNEFNDDESTQQQQQHQHQGLVIITGIGKGSREGVGVLRDAVQVLLSTQGLSSTIIATNAGRLFVPWSTVSEFMERQWEQMQREHVFAAARARYVGVGVGIAGVMAAMLILPRLGPWL